MTDRTEACTPEERRLLDVLMQSKRVTVGGRNHTAYLEFSYPSAEAFPSIFHTVRNDRD